MELTRRSEQRLATVHPDLQRVVRRAAKLTTLDFNVSEGVRTLEKQRQYIAAGASQTMNSRHLTGHAVDLAAIINGQARWDWPLYHTLASIMKLAAEIENVPLEWGGDWKGRFRDGPHFQLPWKDYPVPKKEQA